MAAQEQYPPVDARSLVEDVVVPRLLQGTVALVLSDAADGADEHAAHSARLPRRFASIEHAHGSYEVCWVVRGRCVLAVAGRRLPLDPGVACLVRPGEMHQLWPTRALEPFEVLWWCISPRGISLPLEGFSGEHRVILGDYVALETGTAVPARVAQELERRQARGDLLARALLLQLAAVILRRLDEIAAGRADAWVSGRKGNWHVDRVVYYVETNFGADLTLERLARVAGLSPFYLTTLFRRVTGRSAMGYVRDVRHRQALALLRSTELDVAAVSRQVGYEDPYYFSRVFKARQGCSPLEYRRRARNDLPAAEG